MFPYISKSITNVLIIPKIINCFHLDFEPGKAPNTEAHDFWEIVYVEKGKASAISDDTEIPLSDGDIIFHKPNEHHDVYNVGNTTMTAHFISFECKSKIMQLFENRTIKSDYETRKILHMMFDIAEKSFETHFKNGYVYIKQKKNSPIGGMQMYRLYLEQFLLTLVHKIEKQSSNSVYASKEEFEQNLFEKIKELIDENIYGSLSVDDICLKLNYSRSYITKLFKRMEGTAITHYYNTRKITEAKKLLKNKSNSISHISDMLGYNTPYYFSYAFKKSEGISPIEYRKSEFMY